MSRTRYWDHGKGDFRPYPPGRTVNPVFGRAPQIIKSFVPYQSIAERSPEGVGIMINSRAEHREALKRTDCIETGTEKPAWMKEGDYIRKHGAGWEDVPDGSAPVPKDENVGDFSWQEISAGLS